MNERPILEVKKLAVTYKTRKREIEAVRDVSFTIRSGENLGLVGESGCGKSTAAFALVNYLGRNGYISDGSILFKGEEMRNRTERELRALRGGDISMVYQEPMSALNPTMTIGNQMTEALIAHQGMSLNQAREACRKKLSECVYARPGKCPGPICASAFRRTAAAGADCHGSPQQPGPADHGRADHGIRRDR